MFTGLVSATGEVRRARARRGSLRLEIRCPTVARALGRGDSVAVNGVCLTAVETGRKSFETDVMAETLARTTLGTLRKGAVVNLELAARLADRLGGHLVQGHIDGVARVARVEDHEGTRRMWLTASTDVLRYLVPRGSVALDGVSLTVVEVGQTAFQIALIPHTLDVTTLDGASPGAEVNVEVDVLAKYVERLSERRL